MYDPIQETIMINDGDSKWIPGSQEQDDFYLSQPILYICYGKIIEAHILSGRQTLGRKSGRVQPDIAVQNPYISKCHGYFETVGTTVFYVAENTTNGIYVRNRKLQCGEQIELHDGDELRIPVRSPGSRFDEILLICAKTKPRNMMWQAFQYAGLDSLTRFQGRGAFRDRFDCMTCHTLSVFMLDIDKFKEINDAYGHANGDKAIKALAERLEKSLGNSNYLCRWGGDEFVGMLEADLETAVKALENIQQKLAQSEFDSSFRLRISVGIVEVSAASGKQLFEALMDQVDKELYKAKESGGNCISACRLGTGSVACDRRIEKNGED